MVCVVETGKPSLVATRSQDALPISAQVMASMREPGFPSKRLMEMMLFLMVLVTRAPRPTAPTNSVMMERIPAWGMLSVLAATEEAYELATSLAPLPKALQMKAMEMMARSQLYLAVAGGAILPWMLSSSLLLLLLLEGSG